MYHLNITQIGTSLGDNDVFFVPAFYYDTTEQLSNHKEATVAPIGYTIVNSLQSLTKNNGSVLLFRHRFPRLELSVHRVRLFDKNTEALCVMMY